MSDQPAKALSVRQPWAEAVVRGLKRWATRSWRTHYRGRLLIHAAKHWTGSQVSTWHVWMDGSTLRGRWHPGLTWLDVCGAYEDLDLGCVIGEVEVVDCLPTTLVRGRMDADEGMMGDWNLGRWAWKLVRPVKYDTPRPCRGRRGLFNIILPDPGQEWTPHKRRAMTFADGEDAAASARDFEGACPEYS